MKFQAKSEAKLIEEKLLPVGEYPYEIYDAADKVSKAGNDMIELGLKVFRPDGRSEIISDYLLPTLPFKLIHAAQSCGLGGKYNTGVLTADDFIGKGGILKLKIQDAKDGWPARNVVADYVVDKNNLGGAGIKEETKPFIDDSDIPF
jgi:hypothetical protein